MKKPIVHLHDASRDRTMCGRRLVEVVHTDVPAKMTCAGCRRVRDRAARSARFMDLPLDERRRAATRSPINRGER
jgi:hypothetical protein